MSKVQRALNIVLGHRVFKGVQSMDPLQIQDAEESGVQACARKRV